MSYSVGIDFGTESGRAVVVDLDDGRILGSAELAYRHGVMDEHLPGSTDRLPFSSALQDADDYLEILGIAVPEAVRESGVSRRTSSPSAWMRRHPRPCPPGTTAHR